jgi:hypothetical protein
MRRAKFDYGSHACYYKDRWLTMRRGQVVGVEKEVSQCEQMR